MLLSKHIACSEAAKASAVLASPSHTCPPLSSRQAFKRIRLLDGCPVCARHYFEHPKIRDPEQRSCLNLSPGLTRAEASGPGQRDGPCGSEMGSTDPPPSMRGKVLYAKGSTKHWTATSTSWRAKLGAKYYGNNPLQHLHTNAPPCLALQATQEGPKTARKPCSVSPPLWSNRTRPRATGAAHVQQVQAGQTPSRPAPAAR